MKNYLFFVLYILITTNGFAQRIKSIDISYGTFDAEKEYFQRIVMCSESDSINMYYGNDTEGKRIVEANKYSKAIVNIDRQTLEQYITKSLKDYQNKENETKQISVENYNIRVEYTDGTWGKYSFPATLYLLTEEKTLEKYRYYMNNMFFLFRSYFHLY